MSEFPFWFQNIREILSLGSSQINISRSCVFSEKSGERINDDENIIMRGGQCMFCS